MRIHHVRLQQSCGFTLIEIAIVLVIVGLLLSGVLRGRELIANARVRALILQMDGVKAAYFGFLDRYRALPGDYLNATATISGVAATAVCNNGNGDGNGQIVIANNENILAWEHLSKAGFITGSYTCASLFTATSAPINPYGQFYDLAYNASYAGTSPQPRHNLRTGGQIPSDILSEVDRKVDDGNAVQGSFRAQLGGGVSTTTTECYTGAGVWAATPPGSNCGGAVMFY
jgi:prepilin-type N-terminal cleavage/methylation domain-containing protein